MFVAPMAKRRKLEFGSITTEKTFEVQESPLPMGPDEEVELNLPASWIIDNMNLDLYLQKLRIEMDCETPAAAPIPSSPIRTEYRKILTAANVVQEVKSTQDNKLIWMKRNMSLLNQDIDSLLNRKKLLEKRIEELKQEVLDLKANLTANTQKAVATIIEIREEDDVEADLNSVDDYSQYKKISRLCDVALKSFNDLLIKSKKLSQEMTVKRQKLKARRKLTLQCQIPPDRHQKFEKLSRITQKFSLDEVRYIEKFSK